MPQISVVTGAHLCRNPRVVKEARALGEAGYEVLVLGPRLSDELAEQDTEIDRDAPWTHRYTVDITSGAGRTAHRAVRRAATEAVARAGWPLPDALGYGVRQTLRAALAADADLTIGHQEVGAWVAAELLRRGHRAGADIEDWYSRDLPPESRTGRPVGLLQDCERALIRSGAHVTTTSHALADALADTYRGPTPGVVYNAFLWSERGGLDGEARDRDDLETPSIHWVSQTIGAGRGLDVLFEALRAVRRPVQVHLRGRLAPGVEGDLRTAFPSESGHRLVFHGLVPPSELLGRIAEHDIGVALEETEPDNKDLTVSNKILHYLVGGLAVVASETAGQREVAEAAPDAVTLCGAADPAGLADGLNRLLETPGALARAKAASLEAARERFSWERQVPTLLASVASAVGHPAPPARPVLEPAVG